MALTLEEKHEKDKKYAEEALGFIKAEWAKVNAANETAKNVEAEVKITIGKYLVNKFFKGEWERTNEKEPKAARVGAWKELLKDKRYPFKGKSAQYNILKCGGQAIWAEKEQIDLSGINFTSQVYLTRLECGDEKKEAIAKVIAGMVGEDGKKRPWTSREIEVYIRDLTKDTSSTGLPDDFEALLKGNGLKDYLEDIKKYQQYTPKTSDPDKENEVDADKRKNIKDAIEAAIKTRNEGIKKEREEIKKLRKVAASLGKKEIIEDEDFDEWEDQAASNS
jgi:hypothetical protein